MPRDRRSGTTSTGLQGLSCERSCLWVVQALLPGWFPVRVVVARSFLEQLQTLRIDLNGHNDCESGEFVPGQEAEADPAFFPFLDLWLYAEISVCLMRGTRT